MSENDTPALRAADFLLDQAEARHEEVRTAVHPVLQYQDHSYTTNPHPPGYVMGKFESGPNGIPTNPFGGRVGAVFSSAEHPNGISYIAPWEDPFSGFPEHCRRNAEALATATPVHLRSFISAIRGYTPGLEEVEQRMKPLLETSVAGYRAVVCQIVPSERAIASLTAYRGLRGKDLEIVLQRKVAYIVLERDRVSNTIARTLNRLGQVWISCELSQEALVNSGVEREKIHIVHMPHRPSDPMLTLRGRKRAGGVPRFYHIGKWEPRKAQDKLLVAFMRAFKPGEARLLVKTGRPFFPSTPGYPRDALTAVHEALADEGAIANGWTTDNATASIALDTDLKSEDEIRNIHAWGEFYLSLSHGEGWDMPAFDAMLAGNAVVYTPSGGPSEFLHGEPHIEVPFVGRIPAHPCYEEWLDARYWEYNVDAAAATLRQAASRRNPILTDDYQRFAPEFVGQVMLSYLNKLK